MTVCLGFEEFFKNIISEEVSNLPRGVAHSKMKKFEISETKFMASIPELLRRQYDKCKQPALKCSIAGKINEFIFNGKFICLEIYRRKHGLCFIQGRNCKKSKETRPECHP